MARKPPLSDLIGENASPEREGNARGFIHPELDDGEEAIGLVVREKGQASSGRQSFAEGDGSHHSDFVTERQFAINASLRILTSFTRGRSGG